MSSRFFGECSPESKIKIEIVAEYFAVWSNVIKSAVLSSRARRLAYCDLYCGPGVYNDGTKSTPLRIAEHAINSEFLRQSLVMLFNDENPKACKNLQSYLSNLQDSKKFNHAPIIGNKSVDDVIANHFSDRNLVPTLLFADPFGYKGLSLQLISAFLKDWGCDCVFFFNYNRINPGLQNENVRQHMDKLFGIEAAEELRRKLADNKNAKEREKIITKKLEESLASIGGKYTISFRFKTTTGRTTHLLVYTSKEFIGYKIMKDIMAKKGEFVNGYAPTFEHIREAKQLRLVPRSTHSESQLSQLLLAKYGGRKITVAQIFEEHSPNTPWVLKNYRNALVKLENDGLIRVEGKLRRRPGSMAEGNIVTFLAGDTT